MNHSVAGDVVVIADVGKATGTMVTTAVVHGVTLRGTGGTTVYHNQIDEAIKRPFKNASTFEVKRLGVLIKMSKRFCFILKRCVVVLFAFNCIFIIGARTPKEKFIKT